MVWDEQTLAAIDLAAKWFFAGNRDDNGLMEKYGLRVMDRIGESYTRIAYSQGSYRNPKK